jgi:hypothetical protein
MAASAVQAATAVRSSAPATHSAASSPQARAASVSMLLLQVVLCLTTVDHVVDALRPHCLPSELKLPSQSPIYRRMAKMHNESQSLFVKVHDLTWVHVNNTNCTTSRLRINADCKPDTDTIQSAWQCKGVSCGRDGQAKRTSSGVQSSGSTESKRAKRPDDSTMPPACPDCGRVDFDSWGAYNGHASQCVLRPADAVCPPCEQEEVEDSAANDRLESDITNIQRAYLEATAALHLKHYVSVAGIQRAKEAFHRVSELTAASLARALRDVKDTSDIQDLVKRITSAVDPLLTAKREATAQNSLYEYEIEPVPRKLGTREELSYVGKGKRRVSNTVSAVVYDIPLEKVCNCP